MTSRVVLHHQTRYRYDRPVSLGQQTVRLCPVDWVRPMVRHYALTVSPAGADIVWGHDGYGNRVAKVAIAGRLTHFDLSASLEVDLADIDIGFRHRGSCALGSCEDVQDPNAVSAYQARVPVAPSVAAYAQEWAWVVERGDLAAFEELNKALAARLVYRRRLEPGVWTPAQTLECGSGSCRDSAWLLVTMLRHLGMPARFVSGYLVQPEADASLSCDLHAWAEVWIEGLGWVGFDTTSGLVAARHHIPLAVAMSPEETAPVSGMLDRCEATLDVTMKVTPLSRTTDEVALVRS